VRELEPPVNPEISDPYWIAAFGSVVVGIIFSGLWRGRFGKTSELKRAARNAPPFVIGSLLISEFDFLIGLAVLYAVAVEALGPIEGIRIGQESTATQSRIDSVLARSAWGAVFVGAGVIYLATGAVRFSTLGRSLVQNPDGASPLATIGLWLFVVGLSLGLLPHLGASSRRFRTMRLDLLAFAVLPVRIFAVIGLFRILRVTVDLSWLARIEAIGFLLLFSAVVGAVTLSDIRRRVAFFGLAASAILLFSMGDLGYANSPERLSSLLDFGVLHLGVSLSIAYAALAQLMVSDQSTRADSFRGRAYVHPLPALSFSAALLSLAALPPSGGFRIALDSSLRAIDRGAPGIAAGILIGQGILICLGLSLVRTLYMSGEPLTWTLHRPGPESQERSQLLWVFALVLLLLISFIPTSPLAK